MTRIRIKEKVTQRTWLWIPELSLCIKTGYKMLVSPGWSGYTEFNDNNEPVLDSWTVEPVVLILK